MSSSVQRPLDQLVPASLDAEQQVFDENHVLLQAGEAQLRSGLLQGQDLLPVSVDLVDEHLTGHRRTQTSVSVNHRLSVPGDGGLLQFNVHLVFVDLEEHCVQDEAGGLGHVQGLFGLGQPVDGVLQGRLEARCQGDGLIQFGLLKKEGFYF